jgi:hypothetical protein
MKNTYNYLAIFALLLVFVLPVLGNNSSETANIEITQTNGISVKARLKNNNNPKNGTRVFVTIVNESEQTYSNLRFRYFVDLSSELSREYNLSDIYVTTLANEGRGATQLQRFAGSKNIFFVEGSFAGVAIEPNQTKTIEFNINIGSTDYRGQPSTAWEAENDPSYIGLTDETAETKFIVVYDLSLPIEHQLIWGQEPTSSVIKQLKADPTEPISKELPETDKILTNNFTATKNVELSVINLWNTGYCANLDINPDLNINNWQVDIGLSGRVYEVWGAQKQKTNSGIILTPDLWTKNIKAGETAQAGFCVNGTPDAKVGNAVLTRSSLPITLTNGALQAEINYKSAWSEGYCTDITITNTSDSRLSWRALTINLENSEIGNAWSALYDESGNLLVIRPESWNRILRGGEVIHFGFCGVGSPDVEPLFFQ